ncbi:MAG: hypothetical protein QFB86_04720 [Patescibacteria group bacterium]|nr:hypothetical protein [Patescibacteria group bacterium]
MSLFDSLEHEAEAIMKDPVKRAKIEQIAQEKGITLDAAKAHFLKHGNKA